MITSKTVKEAGISFGADLVGIGTMDRFEGAPANMDPRYIFPEAKSIIGLAFRIHRGALRGPEEGTSFGVYGSAGYANINNTHIPDTIRKLASFIEDRGYEAVPYGQGHRHTWGPTGKPARPGNPQPDVLIHVRIAGLICGLGEIGWSKIFLTPQFGPRQRLAFIFTDAELEPDPVFKGGLCDRCMLCVKDCPSQAIPGNQEQSESVTICGRTFSWGKLRETRCMIGFQAACPEKNPFLGAEMDSRNPETRRMIEDAYQRGDSPEDDDFRRQVVWHVEQNFRPSSEGNRLYHYTSAVCGASCMRTCMVHLEKQDKLQNKFKNKFRIRKPWQISYDS